MSKKCGKLSEISKMFENLKFDFEKIDNEGIKDMMEIIKSKKTQDISYIQSIKWKI